MKTCAWIAMGLGVMLWISGCSRPAANPPSDAPPAPQQQASEAAPAGTTAAPEEVNVTLPEPAIPPAESAKPAEPAKPAEAAVEPAKPEEPVTGPAMVAPAAPASEAPAAPSTEAKEATPAETPAPAADKPAEGGQAKSGTGKVMGAMRRALIKGFTGASSDQPAEEAPKPNQ